MRLDNLPNEVLFMVLERLSPVDKFTMRQTARKFRSFVDSQGILPLHPTRFFLDFERQMIILSYSHEETDEITVVNGTMPGNWERMDRRESGTNRRIFCDVGNNWTNYVKHYVNKLNRHHRETFLCNLHVRLQLNAAVPNELLQLAVSLDKVDIYTTPTDPRVFEPLPQALDVWLSNGTPKTISVFYTFSVSQIDRLKTPNFSCALNDEGAVHVLNMLFDSDDFSHSQSWTFEVEPNSTNFQEALRVRVGLEPETIPSLYGKPFVHTYGRKQLIIMPTPNMDRIMMLID